MNVFVSGSRAVNKFDENVLNALFDELNSGVRILVGDADGVDTELQKFCAAQQYKNVTVFATNGKVRNNVGNFTVQNVPMDKNAYYKTFFVQKDIAMTDTADYGVVIWDGKSKGTFNNIERLVKQNKPCHVYLANDKRWVTVENEYSLKNLNSSGVFIPVQNGARQLSFV